MSSEAVVPQSWAGCAAHARRQLHPGPSDVPCPAVGVDSCVEAVVDVLVSHVKRAACSSSWLNLVGPPGGGKTTVFRWGLHVVWDRVRYGLLARPGQTEEKPPGGDVEVLAADRRWRRAEQQGKQLRAAGATQQLSDVSLRLRPVGVQDCCPDCYRPSYLCNAAVLTVELRGAEMSSALSAYRSVLQQLLVHRTMAELLVDCKLTARPDQRDRIGGAQLLHAELQLRHLLRHTRQTVVLWISDFDSVAARASSVADVLHPLLFCLADVVHVVGSSSLVVVAESVQHTLRDVEPRIHSRMTGLRMLSVLPELTPHTDPVRDFVVTRLVVPSTWHMCMQCGAADGGHPLLTFLQDCDGGVCAQELPQHEWDLSGGWPAPVRRKRRRTEGTAQLLPCGGSAAAGPVHSADAFVSTAAGAPLVRCVRLWLTQGGCVTLPADPPPGGDQLWGTRVALLPPAGHQVVGWYRTAGEGEVGASFGASFGLVTAPGCAAGSEPPELAVGWNAAVTAAAGSDSLRQVLAATRSFAVLSDILRDWLAALSAHRLQPALNAAAAAAPDGTHTDVAVARELLPGLCCLMDVVVLLPTRACVPGRLQLELRAVAAERVADEAAALAEQHQAGPGCTPTLRQLDNAGLLLLLHLVKFQTGATAVRLTETFRMQYAAALRRMEPLTQSAADSMLCGLRELQRLRLIRPLGRGGHSVVTCVERRDLHAYLRAERKGRSRRPFELYGVVPIDDPVSYVGT